MIVIKKSSVEMFLPPYVLQDQLRNSGKYLDMVKCKWFNGTKEF